MMKKCRCGRTITEKYKRLCPICREKAKEKKKAYDREYHAKRAFEAGSRTEEEKIKKLVGKRDPYDVCAELTDKIFELTGEKAEKLIVSIRNEEKLGIISVHQAIQELESILKHYEAKEHDPWRCRLCMRLIEGGIYKHPDIVNRDEARKARGEIKKKPDWTGWRFPDKIEISEKID